MQIKVVKAMPSYATISLTQYFTNFPASGVHLHTGSQVWLHPEVLIYLEWNSCISINFLYAQTYVNIFLPHLLLLFSV